MDIGITGSTGLIGTALTESLAADGHRVVRFVRPTTAGAPEGDTVRWDPSAGEIDDTAVAALDAVVHLAGVGIADSRWTDEQKERILRSRTDGTTLVAGAVAAASSPPALLSSSAIGYYGDTGDTIVDETAAPGDDFTATVCVQWEDAAAAAVDSDARVVFLRTGIVQSTEGGALGKQLPFFKLGLGGRAGSGRQWISWISVRDEVRAIRHLLTADVSGPVNLVAPEPVTNAEYTSTLGSVLHRPTTILPMFGPRLLYGRELADSLLLTSQRVAPTALLDSGFEFTDPTLRGALEHLLG